MTIIKRTKNAKGSRIFLTICLLVIGAGLAYGSSKKLSRELEQVSSSGDIDVIVQFNQTPTARHHKKIFDRGGVLKQDLGQFKGGAYKLSASSLADLASDPEVAYISPDRPLRNSATGNPKAVLDNHLASIGASARNDLDIT